MTTISKVKVCEGCWQIWSDGINGEELLKVFTSEEQADNYLNKGDKIKYETIQDDYYDYLWQVVPELMHNEDKVLDMLADGYLLEDYLESIGLTEDDIDFS